jgi:Ser/Thr protein kinase RdoA (MazF antagonist)
MSLKEIIAVPAHWGLEIEESEPLSERATLIRTNKTNYILKKKENVGKTLTEVTLLKALNSDNIRVQMPVVNNNGEYTFTYNNDVYAIYNYIDGDVIKAKDSLKHPSVPRSLGETIGDLHKNMKKTSLDEKFISRNLYKGVYEWALKEIIKVYPNQNLKNIYLSLEADIKKRSEELPKQLIHRDAHISNFIFKNDQIVGIIDFDLVEVNVRIFDVCYCSTSVLSEIFSDESKRKEWIDFLGEIVRGYSQKNPLSDFEINSIWYVMLCIQTIFMAYFCNHSTIFETNKEMFLWIFENRDKIEKTLL